MVKLLDTVIVSSGPNRGFQGTVTALERSSLYRGRTVVIQAEDSGDWIEESEGRVQLHDHVSLYEGSTQD